MGIFDRRQVLRSAIAGSAAALFAPSVSLSAEQQGTAQPATAAPAPTPRHGRIHQSVSRWCYQKIALDDLCKAAVQMGLKGIDLLQPDEFEVPRRYGLICTMGYVGAGDIRKALNRLENHDAIEAALRKNVPLAAKAGDRKSVV